MTQDMPPTEKIKPWEVQCPFCRLHGQVYEAKFKVVLSITAKQDRAIPDDLIAQPMICVKCGTIWIRSTDQEVTPSRAERRRRGLIVVSGKEGE